MRWPWQWGRAEHRQSQSYTDALTAALFAGAKGTNGTAATTAALEACSQLYGMCFAAARIEGAPPMIADAITPACRELIARNLVRRGEDVHLIATGAGGLRLLPAGGWDIRGGADPADWYVRLDIYGPSGTYTTTVPHAATVHCRYAVDSALPWRGVPPLGWARSTGALAGRLEDGLSNEAGGSAAYLLPVPQDGGDGGDDDPLKRLKSDIALAKGKVTLVETTSAGWGEGAGGKPARDWEQKRVGADWPDVLRATRKDVFENVAAACGVPGVLLDPRAEGTSQREGLRRFAHLAIEPLAELVAAELRMKLDAPSLRFNFDGLMASDLAGRARALGILVKSAGFSREQAARIAGLE